MDKKPKSFKLLCHLDGEVAPFPVEVDDLGTVTVGDLKQMIAGKKKNTITCKPNYLKLYLALNNGQWLECTEDLSKSEDSKMRISPKNCMHPTHQLSLYFKDENDPQLKGRIHVLVVVPEETITHDRFIPRKKQRRRIDLKEYCLATSQFFNDLPQFPQIQDLRDLLLRPLPFRLDIDDTLLAKEVFASDASLVECNILTSHIDIITIKRKLMASSENNWQSFNDLFLLLTQTICRAIEFNVKVQRNKCDATTLRPDCLIRTGKGLVLCRGEEKCMSIDIEMSLSRLTNKMSTWNPVFYGKLPYILGYATSGNDISVVAIDRCRVKHEIILNQSLYEFQGRGNLIKIFYNMAFFFKVMEIKSKRFTDIRLKPFTRQETTTRTLEMVDSGIRRTYKDSAEDFGRYVNIYQTLKKINEQTRNRNHLQIVRELSLKKTTLIVLLSPLGFERTPMTLAEVREWIVAMLMALSNWHGSNYCHGDISWRNIVFVPTDTEGYWMLIDMDESYPPNTRKIDWNHDRRGDILTFQHDLFQLGLLMKDFKFPLTEELKKLKNTLLASIGTELTADELLLSLL